MFNLSINFAPIELDGGPDVSIGRQPYDDARLKELRREFGTTHIFYRDGRNSAIVDIPVATNVDPIGNVRQRVDLRRMPGAWSPLFTAALLRVFHGLRTIESVRPVSVLGAESKGLVQHPRLPRLFQKRSALQFHTRSIYLPGGKRIFGLVIETRLRNLIHASCAELLMLGVPIVGRYVQIEESPDDSRLSPRRSLVGRVALVNGSSLVLTDNREGFETIDAAGSFLEPRKEIFDDCIRRLLGGDAPAVLDSAEAQASQFHSGPGRKQQIQGALLYLRDKADLQAVPGVRFKLGSLLGSDSRDFPATETMPRPILVFDPSGSRKDDWNERGLKKNGPYDQRTFSAKKLRIAVICQAKFEGQVDRFVAKFLDGMPETLTGAKKVARYGDGFLRRFQLGKPSVRFFTAKTASVGDYEAASRELLQVATDDGVKWDLALVQVEEEFKKCDGPNNPYYATKSILLKRDIAVQSVRLETMAQKDQELVFSLNHMSLATYAKLGGTPWLLAAHQTVAHELVIGLGSHSVAGARIGAAKRFVGITTVFSSDGSYLLSDKTAVVPFERYADALYETLKRAITTVRKQDNWRSTDKVRLVFHMFKPPKETEADAIKRTVDDLGLENVTFAFLHVASDHPFVIFDHTQNGIGYRDPKKGVLGPARGLHVKLGDFESLVMFSGASELKQPSDGMPRPALLKLHHLSTFKDMTYLARQAFEFSGHSWRMLSPEPFPITIRYSDLIAERLAGLDAVPGWDPEAVRFGQIGRTLWFL